MAVRSTKLWQTNSITTDPSTVYTVPTGRTAVVRSATLMNLGAVAVIASLRIGSVAWWLVTVPAATTVAVPYHVVNPGEVVSVTGATAATPLRSAGFGSLLLGAPE